MGKQVGHLIRQLREERGLSQSEVARLLRLKTAQSISNIERGVSPLPRAKVKRLAEVLRVNKSDILNVVLVEMQERYSKTVGVAGRGRVILGADLSANEWTLIQRLVDHLTSASKPERTVIARKLESLL